MVASVSDYVRSQYQPLAVQARAQSEMDVAKAFEHPDQIVQLSALITRSQRYLDNELKRAADLAGYVADMDKQPDGPGRSPADRARQHMQLAQILAKIEGLRHTIRSAATKEQTVKEAYALWLANPAGDRTVSQFAASLATEPCQRDWGNQTASDSFLNLRGAALGMTYGEVIRGVCDANAKAITVTARNQRPTHVREWREANSSALSQWGSKLSQSHLGGLTFCLDCLPAPGRVGWTWSPAASDTLSVNFLPDGRVGQITRTQKFLDRTGPSPVDAPKKLGLLLPPLEERFGKPSFILEDSQAISVGWVYPDRRSPLPLERWYHPDPNLSAVELNGPGLIYERGQLSPKMTARQKPVATQCLSRNGSGLAMHRQTYAATMFRDNDLTGAKECGVVVSAVFSRVSNFASSNDAFSRTKVNAPPPLSTDANIYSAGIFVRDTTAYAQLEQKERQEIRSAAASAAAEVERKANIADKAFAP